MTQKLPLQELYTFEEFIECFPNDGKRYELHNGVIIEMPPPTGDHEEIIGFLTKQITAEFERCKLSYLIPKTGLVKTSSNKSAYIPDILVLNRNNLKNEPLWKKESTIIYPETTSLIVEVISTNWQDDYYLKFGDYEKMGISEYWIIDYAALGGRKFIGNPKQPTIFVCELIDGEYQMTPFRGNDRIISPTFPQLNLTAQQVFDSVI
jgi:Uma2 family endonuclease